MMANPDRSMNMSNPNDIDSNDDGRVEADIAEGLRQSAAGEVVDLGSFEQYIDDITDGQVAVALAAWNGGHGTEWGAMRAALRAAAEVADGA